MSARSLRRRLEALRATELGGLAGDSLYTAIWLAAVSVADLVQTALVRPVIRPTVIRGGSKECPPGRLRAQIPAERGRTFGPGPRRISDVVRSARAMEDPRVSIEDWWHEMANAERPRRPLLQRFLHP